MLEILIDYHKGLLMCFPESKNSTANKSNYLLTDNQPAVSRLVTR